MGERSNTFAPGQVVPGTVYRVVRHLATGGMGTVYDVEDTSVGKRYVLKTIHPNLVTRKDLVRRMQLEARALGRMSHPNVVDVITAGTTADEPPLPYFVMERLDGRNLRAVLERKGALDPRLALSIAIEMLDALAHAHGHGIVHRDVKPENVFLHRLPSGATATKLLDFGVTRLVDGPSQDTRGRFVGTLRYASPEQVDGGEVTPASDLYAAGLVLFELLVGRGPFDGRGDARAIAASHLEEEAPSLGEVSAGALPPELVALVASALAKRRGARPSSAEAFATALRRIRATLDVASGDATLPGALSAAAEPPSEASTTERGGARAPDASALPSTRPAGGRPRPAPPPADALATTGVDRGAPTRSLVADATQRLPRHGTELDAPAPPPASTLRLDALPRGLGVGGSEPTPPPVSGEPVVAPPPGRREPARGGKLGVAFALGLVLLGGAAVLAVTNLRRASRAPEASDELGARAAEDEVRGSPGAWSSAPPAAAPSPVAPAVPAAMPSSSGAVAPTSPSSPSGTASSRGAPASPARAAAPSRRLTGDAGGARNTPSGQALPGLDF